MTGLLNRESRSQHAQPNLNGFINEYNMFRRIKFDVDSIQGFLDIKVSRHVKMTTHISRHTDNHCQYITQSCV